jgi:hypothetical protein
LTASHLQEVLALESAQQERLLRAADGGNWTVSRLRAEVSRERPAGSHARRRYVTRTVGKLRALLSDVQRALAEGETMLELGADAARDFAKTLTAVESQLDALDRLLLPSG